MSVYKNPRSVRNVNFPPVPPEPPEPPRREEHDDKREVAAGAAIMCVAATVHQVIPSRVRFSIYSWSTEGFRWCSKFSGLYLPDRPGGEWLGHGVPIDTMCARATVSLQLDLVAYLDKRLGLSREEGNRFLRENYPAREALTKTLLKQGEINADELHGVLKPVMEEAVHMLCMHRDKWNEPAYRAIAEARYQYLKQIGYLLR